MLHCRVETVKNGKGRITVKEVKRGKKKKEEWEELGGGKTRGRRRGGDLEGRGDGDGEGDGEGKEKTLGMVPVVSSQGLGNSS